MQPSRNPPPTMTEQPNDGGGQPSESPSRRNLEVAKPHPIYSATRVSIDQGRNYDKENNETKTDDAEIKVGPVAKPHPIYCSTRVSIDQGRNYDKENNEATTDDAEMKVSAGPTNLLKREDEDNEDDDDEPTPPTWLGCSESIYYESLHNPIGGPMKSRRGPFKKRLSPHPRSQVSTPFPPAPNLLSNSSLYGLMHATSTPLLRQTSSSSTFSSYMNHYAIPPPFRLTASFGQKLMEAPLMETPQAVPMNVRGHVVTVGHPPQAHLADLTTTPTLLHTDYGARNQRGPVAGVSRFSYTPNFFSFHRGTTPARISGVFQGSKRAANSNIFMPQTANNRTAVVTDRRPIEPSIRSPVTVRPRQLEIPRPETSQGMVLSHPHRKLPVKKEAIEFKPKQRIRLLNPLETHRELFVNVPITSRPCKCGNTQCIKLYCECFRNGSFCDPNLCNCTRCSNVERYNSIPEPRGPRVTAILGILARRPRAFDCEQRVGSTARCRCKKSGYVSLSLAPAVTTFHIVYLTSGLASTLRYFCPPQMSQEVLRVCCCWKYLRLQLHVH
jgi:hypothetical protein